MTRREILEKYGIIRVAAPEWLDEELTEEEAEVFERGCIASKTIFEEEFFDDEEGEPYETEMDQHEG